MRSNNVLNAISIISCFICLMFSAWRVGRDAGNAEVWDICLERPKVTEHTTSSDEQAYTLNNGRVMHINTEQSNYYAHHDEEFHILIQHCQDLPQKMGERCYP